MKQLIKLKFSYKKDDDSNNFENDENEGLNLVNESHEKTSGEYNETVDQETMTLETTNQTENLVQEDDDSKNFEKDENEDFNDPNEANDLNEIGEKTLNED